MYPNVLRVTDQGEVYLVVLPKTVVEVISFYGGDFISINYDSDTLTLIEDHMGYETRESINKCYLEFNVPKSDMYIGLGLYVVSSLDNLVLTTKRLVVK